VIRTFGLVVDVVVAEVGREVHTEANAHYQVNQCHPIKNDSPERHEAEAANQGADDAQDGADSRDCVGKEHTGDGDDDYTGDEDALKGLAKHGEVLVGVGEIAVEHGDLHVFGRHVSCNLSDVQNHSFLIFRAVNVLALNQQSRSDDPGLVFIESHI